MIRPTAKNPHDGLPRGLVIGMAHVSHQRDRLIGPHRDLLAQTSSKEILQIRNIDPPWERRDVHYAHVVTSGPACASRSAESPSARQLVKTTPVSTKPGSGFRPPC